MMNKEERLKESNTYNPKCDKVTARDFIENEVMDSRDLLQVRYEIVRAIEYDNKPVKDICSEFGVSASTARRYVRNLKEGGLIALVPEQKGPSGPTKLSKDAANFIDTLLICTLFPLKILFFSQIKTGSARGLWSDTCQKKARAARAATSGENKFSRRRKEDRGL